MKKGKIDKLGRIVIPASYRSILNIDESSEVELSLVKRSVLITPCNMLCKLCSAKLIEKSSLQICRDCIKHIKRIE